MQQRQALLKQQLEFLSSAPFGDSPLFRMGLKVCTYIRTYVRIANDCQWLAQQVCTYTYVAAVGEFASVIDTRGAVMFIYSWMLQRDYASSSSIPKRQLASGGCCVLMN